jgi:hypothetical protein
MQYGVSWAKFESMGTREIAEAVCRMPSEFYERRNISMLDLLKESGYLQDPDAVTEEELERVFRSFPDLIDGWVTICDEPNRYHWILQPPAATSESSDWVVIYPNERKYDLYSEGAKACAFVTKKKIERYRSIIG